MTFSIRRHVGIPALVLAIATPLVTREEGIVLHAYRDPVGIWTACVGDTQGVQPGQTFTYAECTARLQNRLPDYYGPITECRPALKDAPASVQAALVSFAYNEGSYMVCRPQSTIGAAISRRDWRGVCDALLIYTRAGNFPYLLRGRRERERQVCLQGVN